MCSEPLLAWRRDGDGGFSAKRLAPGADVHGRVEDNPVALLRALAQPEGPRAPVSSDPHDSAGRPYHALDAGEVLRLLHVDPKRGLSSEEVSRRRDRYGENRVAQDVGAKPLAMLARQFTDLMIIVLLVAAVVAGLVGEPVDAVAILVIVVLNAIVGFIQEYRAEHALQALQRLSAPRVRVLRTTRR